MCVSWSITHSHILYTHTHAEKDTPFRSRANPGSLSLDLYSRNGREHKEKEKKRLFACALHAGRREGGDTLLLECLGWCVRVCVQPTRALPYSCPPPSNQPLHYIAVLIRAPGFPNPHRFLWCTPTPSWVVFGTVCVLWWWCFCFFFFFSLPAVRSLPHAKGGGGTRCPQGLSLANRRTPLWLWVWQVVCPPWRSGWTGWLMCILCA